MSSSLSIWIDWLVASERGRRLRRWSFIATLPGAVTVALAVGLGSGLALVAVRFVFVIVGVAVAWRLPGERGEAVRDLLMHPRARRYLRLELRVLATLWLALRRRDRSAFSYHRGDEQPAIALALLPMLLAEAAVAHLLLPGGWLWAHIAVACTHAYGLLWLFAWAAGPRLRPHRVSGGLLLVRAGVLYEARVPLETVRSVVVRRRRVGGAATLAVEGGGVLLPARRRVDLWLELAEPVVVARPLGEPITTRLLAIAVDEPDRLAAALVRPPAGSEHRAKRASALLALPELAYGSH